MAKHFPLLAVRAKSDVAEAKKPREIPRLF
jgi:hypothetical protein